MFAIAFDLVVADTAFRVEQWSDFTQLVKS